ncbi:MAG: ABC transporter ATP-binding protein [Oscillospiraceae bacterium]|nr:ABC transporter ATP-binding protein [Oscillospiraceae bacterium]
MANVLEVRELSKKYPKRDVFAADKVSFDVKEGEIFALIGPNGAGKTTTIRMISTLIQPTSGDAFVAGHSIIKEPDKVRENITYLPDEAGAYKTMTGRKYLYFMAGLFSADKNEIEKYVQRAMAICGLGDRLDDKIGGYSRGMIRKLLLARAVMTAPKLAIMDEATSGLDVINALEIRKMIKSLAKEHNMSFLLSSHNMLEIEYLSDRVGIIAKGNLMVTGTIEELKERYNAVNLEEVFERVVVENEVR